MTQPMRPRPAGSPRASTPRSTTAPTACRVSGPTEREHPHERGTRIAPRVALQVPGERFADIGRERQPITPAALAAHQPPRDA
jgi:hypothetical protein